jgi:hypothetical protein
MLRIILDYLFTLAQKIKAGPGRALEIHAARYLQYRAIGQKRKIIIGRGGGPGLPRAV